MIFNLERAIAKFSSTYMTCYPWKHSTRSYKSFKEKVLKILVEQNVWYLLRKQTILMQEEVCYVTNVSVFTRQMILFNICGTHKNMEDQ